MSTTVRGFAGKIARVGSVFVPPLVAGGLAFSKSTGHLHIVGLALVLAWCIMAGTVLMRFLEARSLARTYSVRPSVVGHLDVLTAAGRTMMWSGAAAIIAAVATGWASFSVLGVLGLGTACAAVTWTATIAGGEDPWRNATIKREVLPSMATEGDSIREQLTVTNVVIPTGMRLFAQGRAVRHGMMTRYLVGSEGSRAEVVLESDLGPAPRGEHHVPPMAMWLADVLGLARTMIVHRGEAQFTVLPRPGTVDGVRELLGDGGDAAMARPTQHRPTEGTFRIREYQPGDDTRRIHWVRSLQANQLVVRLPDEIPPADPVVRLVLDNCLPGTELLTCKAPDELLDALVHVWLGIGKALGDSGTRVTLATAVKKDEFYTVVERPMHARSPREALRLGARVAWQPQLELPSLLKQGGVRQVVVSTRPRAIDTAPDVAWVIVPEMAWTSPEMWPSAPSWVKLPFPVGHADNRLARREHERQRILTMWQDRSIFSQVVRGIDWASCSGAYLAKPKQGRVALEVLP